MNDVFTFHIRVVQNDDVCILNMETEGFGHIQGSSKRHPADTNNPVIGQCVAFERLFKSLGEHYGEIVEILMAPPKSKDDLPVIDLAEAAWFEQFAIPAQEQGIVEQ